MGLIAVCAAGPVTTVDVTTGVIITSGGGSGTGQAVISNDLATFYNLNVATGVEVIDVATLALTTTITVGTNPIGICISPDGTKLYVSNQTSNSISVIDTGSNTVVATITSTLVAPEGICISPDGLTLYVGTNNPGGGTKYCTVVDIGSATVVTDIALSGTSTGLRVTPDGSTVWCGEAALIEFVDTGSNTVVGSTANALDATDIVFSATDAYVAVNNVPQLVVLDIATQAIITTLTLGMGAGGGAEFVNISQDGTAVGFADSFDGDLGLVDTASNTLTYTVNGLFGGIAFAGTSAPPGPPPVGEIPPLFIPRKTEQDTNYQTDMQTIETWGNTLPLREVIGTSGNPGNFPGGQPAKLSQVVGDVDGSIWVCTTAYNATGPVNAVWNHIT